MPLLAVRLAQRRNQDRAMATKAACFKAQSSGYGASELETLVNVVFKVVPRLFTTVMIAIEMPAAMRPYSIAVAPDSSCKNRAMCNMFFSSLWFADIYECAPTPA